MAGRAEAKKKPTGAPKTKTQEIKETAFVNAVAKGVPISKAYVDAGFKNTKNVRTNASQKLAQPHIHALLEKRKEEFREIANVEALHIIGAQQQIAFASIEDALDDNGNLDIRKAKENGSVALIKKISRQTTKYGENIAVEFYSRQDALGQLADFLGLKQAPKTNENDEKAETLRKIAEDRAKSLNIPYEQVIANMLQVAGGNIKPEVRSVLQVEAVQ